MAAQYIHYGINYLNKDFNSTIYGINTLEKRRTLWKEILKIDATIYGPWFLMGDFNNVLQAQDKTGGNPVHKNEYLYHVEMMEAISLYGKDNIL